MVLLARVYILHSSVYFHPLHRSNADSERNEPARGLFIDSISHLCSTDAWWLSLPCRERDLQCNLLVDSLTFHSSVCCSHVCLFSSSPSRWVISCPPKRERFSLTFTLTLICMFLTTSVGACEFFASTSKRDFVTRRHESNRWKRDCQLNYSTSRSLIFFTT